MGKKAYYSALFHLLVVNFPYALAAWVYLFVFTLVCLTPSFLLVHTINPWPDWDNYLDGFASGCSFVLPQSDRCACICKGRGMASHAPDNSFALNVLILAFVTNHFSWPFSFPSAVSATSDFHPDTLSHTCRDRSRSWNAVWTFVLPKRLFHGMASCRIKGTGRTNFAYSLPIPHPTKHYSISWLSSQALHFSFLLHFLS